MIATRLSGSFTAVGSRSLGSLLGWLPSPNPYQVVSATCWCHCSPAPAGRWSRWVRQPGQEVASIDPRLVAVAEALAQRLPGGQLFGAHLLAVIQVGARRSRRPYDVVR